MHSEYSICEDLDMTWRDNERIWTDNVLIGMGQHSWHICTLSGSTLRRHCGYIWLYVYTLFWSTLHRYGVLIYLLRCIFYLSISVLIYVDLFIFSKACELNLFCSLFFGYSPGKIHGFGGFLPVSFEYSICGHILSGRNDLVQAKKRNNIFYLVEMTITWNKAILGMIPLTNHDYSEVAVRFLRFTRICIYIHHIYWYYK